MRAAHCAVLCILAAVPARASDKTDVTNTIDQYIQAFNKNDMKAFGALCMDNTIIIDNVAPHTWHGASACSDWWKALEDTTKKQGMTGGVVSRGKPVHFETSGETAYAVFPGVYKFQMKGKPASDKGMWAFTLRKAGGGWKISGWSWASQ